MKKFITAVISIALIAALCLPAVKTSALVGDSVADTEYNYNIGENYSGTQNCDVEVIQGSNFIVIIPKLIVVDGSVGQGSYKVTVDANLAGTEFIRVQPVPQNEMGYFLTELGGKKPVEYEVSQPKYIFIANGSITTGLSAEQELYPQELIPDYTVTLREAAVIDGILTIPQLTAGTWTGSFDFNIQLESKVLD